MREGGGGRDVQDLLPPVETGSTRVFLDAVCMSSIFPTSSLLGGKGEGKFFAWLPRADVYDSRWMCRRCAGLGLFTPLHCISSTDYPLYVQYIQPVERPVHAEMSLSPSCVLLRRGLNVPRSARPTRTCPTSTSAFQLIDQPPQILQILHVHIPTTTTIPIHTPLTLPIPLRIPIAPSRDQPHPHHPRPPHRLATPAVASAERSRRRRRRGRAVVAGLLCLLRRGTGCQGEGNDAEEG